MSGIHLDDVTGHQPVEQHAERGQVLLDRRRRKLSLQVLDKGGDVKRFNAGELGDAAGLAPMREAAGGIQVRQARVLVIDLGGEEFKDAPGGLRRRRKKRRRRQFIGGIEDDLVAHWLCRGAMVGGFSVAVTMVGVLPYRVL
jgi:hypothetical protein